MPIVNEMHKSTKLDHKRATTKALRESLKSSVNEKDVENAYRVAISAYFPHQTTSPFNVDGLLACDTVRSLLEFKFNHNLSDKMSQCSVLIQSLFYLKKTALVVSSIICFNKNRACKHEAYLLLLVEQV